jgi:butyryl-CoA dehydrogenase
MTSYRAPLRDMHFVMFEMPGFAALRALPGCADLDAGSVAPALEAAAKLCANVLRPLNRSGDEEGCTVTGDAVRTPREFASAFRAYADGGWAVIAAHPKYGGAHLPHAVRALVEEMVCSANLAFASYTMLIPGAYAALDAHASTSLR